MKFIKTSIILLFTLLIASCSKSDNDHQNHAATDQTQKSASPKSTAMTNIGDTHVHIEYHSPRVRDRVIFGGLVAYDRIWVTGAHRATSIQFYNDVIVNNEKVEKGKYALFTIPGKEEWTIIINKNPEQHLTDDYDEKLDILRFTVTPEELQNSQEELLYEVKETTEGQGEISISWAKVKVSFPISSI